MNNTCHIPRLAHECQDVSMIEYCNRHACFYEIVHQLSTFPRHGRLSQHFLSSLLCAILMRYYRRSMSERIKTKMV